MKFTIAAAIAALSIGGAHAAVIDFQSLEHVDNVNKDEGFTYSEDGFTLTEENMNQGFHTFGTLESRYSGSTALFNDTIGGVTKLVKDGGGVFDLNSIDLAELNGNRVATVTFTGNLSGGGTVTQSFTLDGNAFAPETFSFVGFTNLVSVTWGQDSPFHQFDNIVLDENLAPVPVPASLPLVLTALAGLGFASRRKKH